MPFKSERLTVEGVLKIWPQRFIDRRGYFSETYSRSAFADVGITTEFVQDNEAQSTETGILRGLHYQRAPKAQAKLVRVIAGSIFDVVVDLRDGSPTYGRWCGTTLDADSGAQLFIPAGFAHAYCTLAPATLVAYKVDQFYSPPAEGGIRWNDPDVGIEWPLPPEKITVSDKDSNLPFLRDLPQAPRFRV